MHLLCCKGQSLRYLPRQGNLLHCCCGAICGGGIKEGTILLAELSAGFQSLLPLPTSEFHLSGADFWMSRTLRVPPTDYCEAGNFSHCCLKPHKFLQPEVLRLYFPVLEPWVVWSVSLPSCSSQFIHTQMWDHAVCQLPPCPPQSSWPGILSASAACLCPSYWTE